MDNHINWADIARNPNMDFRIFDNVPGALYNPHSLTDKVALVVAVAICIMLPFSGIAFRF
jgi:hypothetical protein